MFVGGGGVEPALSLDSAGCDTRPGDMARCIPTDCVHAFRVIVCDPAAVSKKNNP